MEDNPLLSHCDIKVCYLGENRNHSVINRESAIKMAKTLHGCPIAGFYDNKQEDFSGHNRSIEVGDGKFRIVDKTKAYGFVDSSSKIWFQDFLDDNQVKRTYLLTEGYLWTTLYPESKRILEHGNNQSMELNEENLDGSWTFDDKGLPKFFIINEAMIQKLCILGEDVEPCFEGAGIAAQFSFDGDFKNKLFSLMEDIKSALNKGGFTSMEENKIVDPTLEDEVNPELDFKKKEEDEKKENPFPPKDDEEKDTPDEGKDDKGESAEKEEDEDEKKKVPAKHSLTDEDILESELYKNLAVEFAQLQKDFDALKAEVEPLRAFKVESDRKAKEEMINSFYMLSDEDKKDCIDNIDTYSLDDIEAKLSIICVRNKVSFNLEDDKKETEVDKKDPLLFSLDNNDDGDSAPAWIKAVRATAKELN